LQVVENKGNTILQQVVEELEDHPPKIDETERFIVLIGNRKKNNLTLTSPDIILFT